MVTLSACGIEDDEVDKTLQTNSRTETSNAVDNNTAMSKFSLNDYLIRDTLSNQVIAKGLDSDQTLMIYPNQPFIFDWDVSAEVVMFGREFLTLEANGKRFSPFSFIDNPRSGSLTADATCVYGNDQIMTCTMPENFEHEVPYYGVHQTTQLSEHINRYPVTFEAYINVCNALQTDCLREKIGNITFN